ncbi:type II secretion system protein N [Candidatus Dependentiae bacterium]
MRYPLWVLNSTLFAMVICALLFIAFSQEELPEREEIEPEVAAAPMQEGLATINLKKIYENDFFGTYERVVVAPEEPKFTIPLPEPPSRVPVEVPVKPKPKFLDPLDITLKGIMSVSDGAKNKAIIADNKTEREAIYKVGDKVADAQLIRIFKNKVIFVRANGQQEVFYLRPEDAKSDPTYLVISDWKPVVRKVTPNNYHIYLEEFSKRVKNLAQFIDILNLTTAYSKGMSVGCRIGSTEPKSLAHELGLKGGDVILTVNGIPATDTQSRLEVYKNITSASLNDVVTVRLQRANQSYTLRYKLADFAIVKKPSGPGQPVTSHYIQKEQEKMLEKRFKFAPTVREIRKKERRNMLSRGKKPNRKKEN